MKVIAISQWKNDPELAIRSHRHLLTTLKFGNVEKVFKSLWRGRLSDFRLIRPSELKSIKSKPASGPEKTTATSQPGLIAHTCGNFSASVFPSNTIHSGKLYGNAGASHRSTDALKFEMNFSASELLYVYLIFLRRRKSHMTSRLNH